MDEAPEPRRTAPAHPGDRRRHQRHAELFAAINSPGGPGSSWKCGTRRMAMIRAPYWTGAVTPCGNEAPPRRICRSGNDASMPRPTRGRGSGRSKTWRAPIAGGHGRRQCRTAAPAGRGKMIDGGVGLGDLAQGRALVPLLPTRLAARLLAKCSASWGAPASARRSTAACRRFRLSRPRRRSSSASRAILLPGRSIRSSFDRTARASRSSNSLNRAPPPRVNQNRAPAPKIYRICPVHHNPQPRGYRQPGRYRLVTMTRPKTEVAPAKIAVCHR